MMAGNGDLGSYGDPYGMAAGVFGLKVPRPPNALPPRNNTVEQFLYVTRRYQGSYHGFDFICGFCGFVKKATTAQAWCHLAQRSLGGTHCQPCLEVPQEVVAMLIKEREEADAKKAQRTKRYVVPMTRMQTFQTTSDGSHLSMDDADAGGMRHAHHAAHNIASGMMLQGPDSSQPAFPLKIPEPPNALPSRKNTIEQYLYVMRRYQGSFHGFDFICGFCGFVKKSTTAQAWCHLARRSRGETHCQPCSEVPEELAAMLIREREELDARKAEKRKQLMSADSGAMKAYELGAHGSEASMDGADGAADGMRKRFRQSEPAMQMMPMVPTMPSESSQPEFALKISEPPNTIPSRKNTIEKYLYITHRYQGSFHGFDFVCGFCGLVKKSTTAQAWCHLARRSRGETHCQPCPEVPDELAAMLIREREEADARRAQLRKQSAPAGLPSFDGAMGESLAEGGAVASFGVRTHFRNDKYHAAPCRVFSDVYN